MDPKERDRQLRLKKPAFLSQEEWEEQLEEMKAYSRHVYKQSGGRLDTYRSLASRLLPKK